MKTKVVERVVYDIIDEDTGNVLASVKDEEQAVALRGQCTDTQLAMFDEDLNVITSFEEGLPHYVKVNNRFAISLFNGMVREYNKKYPSEEDFDFPEIEAFTTDDLANGFYFLNVDTFGVSGTWEFVESAVVTAFLDAVEELPIHLRAILCTSMADSLWMDAEMRKQLDLNQ